MPRDIPQYVERSELQIKARKLRALGSLGLSTIRLHTTAQALGQLDGCESAAQALHQIAWAIQDAFNKIDVPELKM